MKFVCLRYCSMRGCRSPPGRESLALFPLVTNAAANVATASRELCPGSAPEAIRRRWQTGQPMIVAVASCTSLIGSDENVVRQRARAPLKEMECWIIPYLAVRISPSALRRTNSRTEPRCSATSVARKCCWRGSVANSSRSERAALIIAVHSLRDSWPTARSDVRGIMLVLT